MVSTMLLPFPLRAAPETEASLNESSVALCFPYARVPSLVVGELPARKSETPPPPPSRKSPGTSVDKVLPQMSFLTHGGV